MRAQFLGWKLDDDELRKRRSSNMATTKNVTPKTHKGRKNVLQVMAEREATKAAAKTKPVKVAKHKHAFVGTGTSVERTKMLRTGQLRVTHVFDSFKCTTCPETFKGGRTSKQAAQLAARNGRNGK